jgi:hypothetical protein
MKNTLLGILVVIIIILLMIDCNRKSTLQNYKSKYENQLLLLDTVKYYKDKYGATVSSIGVLEVQNAKQVLELKSDREVVKYLQSEIQKYKGKKPETITVIQERIKFDTIIETDSTIIYIDSTGKEREEFIVKFNNDWVNLNGKVNFQSSDISIEINNKYSVAFIKNKKTKKMEVLVTNDNPYSKVTDMVAYKVTQPKPKHFGLGITGGYGLDLINFKPVPYIGVGITYNVIKF